METRLLPLLSIAVISLLAWEQSAQAQKAELDAWQESVLKSNKGEDYQRGKP